MRDTVHDTASLESRRREANAPLKWDEFQSSVAIFSAHKVGAHCLLSTDPKGYLVTEALGYAATNC